MPHADSILGMMDRRDAALAAKSRTAARSAIPVLSISNYILTSIGNSCVARVTALLGRPASSRTFMGTLCKPLLLGLLLAGALPRLASSEELGTIRIGVLHSLTGTMAFSEAPLKDLMEMLIEEQNALGGLLGRPLEAVIVDSGSSDTAYAAGARELIVQHGVDVIFGCWTSACRKVVLPMAEEHNVLLFYPVQYEGQETSRNVFYFGATPNQQAIPAVDYLIDENGGATRRWVLLGTDYVYPRTTNSILRAYLRYLGVSEDDILEIYTPFGHSDWTSIVDEVRAFSAIGLKTAIISTINGDANLYFFRELAAQGIEPSNIPVMSFSIGEAEIRQLGTAAVGHLASWNYFMSIGTPQNQAFVERWRDQTGDQQAVTNDPMEAHMIGFRMWAQSVLQAGTTDTDAVRQAMYGQKVRNLSGGISMMQGNHHISKPALIGRAGPDGQFELVWSSDDLIPADAWSDFLPESAALTADWRYPWVCGGCRVPTHGFPKN